MRREGTAHARERERERERGELERGKGGGGRRYVIMKMLTLAEKIHCKSLHVVISSDFFHSVGCYKSCERKHERVCQP